MTLPKQSHPAASPALRAGVRDRSWARQRSLLEQVFHQFISNRSATIGALVLLTLALAAVFAPYLTPYDYDKIAPADAYASPSRDHLMGADRFGRDVFTRVVYGGRLSLMVGLIAVAIGGSVGGVLGVSAGYFGGLVDEGITRLLDVMLAFPGILLAMAIVATLGPSLSNLMIAVGVGYIPGFARVMRSSVLSVREHDYILAAEALGCRAGTVMWRHILPNIAAPLIVFATLSVASAILTAAGLSFLGLGAQPPTPEWGIMLSDGRDTLNRAWWVSFFPGLAILVTTLSINFVGDGLRTALDPRMRHR